MNYVWKRRLVIILIILIILSFFGYKFYDSFIKEKPTCFDGKKNGLEEGVDCGGNCTKICPFKAKRINRNWTRAFEVKDGVFNIASSIENPNFNYSFDLDFTIKYFNDDGIKAGEKKGTVRLKPLEQRIIFIPGIMLKGQEIKKVFLVDNKIYHLKKESQEKKKIMVISKELMREENELTRLKLVLENTDFIPKHNLEIIVVLFSEDGNVIDINRTFTEYIDKDSRKDIYMTWPKKIPENVANIKVYIREGIEI